MGRWGWGGRLGPGDLLKKGHGNKLSLLGLWWGVSEPQGMKYRTVGPHVINMSSSWCSRHHCSACCCCHCHGHHAGGALRSHRRGEPSGIFQLQVHRLSDFLHCDFMVVCCVVLCCVVLCCVIETGSCYITQVGLKITVEPKPPLSEHWDYTHVPPHPAGTFFF
jgi:hypothetical protein